ncbi:MAG: TolC family protein, partial [Candidatus Omnitrophica bacterium]|nr:TolC family protein [Candidatus Omnitrophota bacterium]
KRATLLCFTVVVLVFAKGQDAVFAQQENTVLNDLIEQALLNNPQARSAYHRWAASEHKIKNVKGLPDPQVSYGYFGSNVETRVGPQKQKFGVDQKIPFPGKLRAKGKAQSKEAQINKEKYQAVKNKIVKDVKLAFYDLYWLDKALEVNKEEKAILGDLQKAAARKYESNLTSQQNVVKLQVELSKNYERFSLIEQSRKSVVAKINRLVNREPNASIDVISQIKKQEFSYELDKLIKNAQEGSSDIAAADLAVEKVEVEESLAKMEYLPDFMFGYEYIEVEDGKTSAFDDGRDAWIGKVSVNIPIWLGKIRSKVKVKQEEAEAAKLERESTERDVVYQVQDLYFKILSYKEIVSLYENALVPQAWQVFESFRTGFETGSASFLDLLDAQRTYLQTRLAYYKTVADYQKSIAYLEQVVGAQLGEGNEK